MLEVKDIHTYYGESHILQGISLKVEKGALIALLGRNGVGKTTLVHSIIGFIPPKQGIIVFKDKEITREPPYRIAQYGVSLVPEGRRIFPSLTVNENLLVAAKIAGKRADNTDQFDLETIYQMFPGLHKRKKHRGNELSGGEQQMLAFGRALISNPEMILMDEPSEGLAPNLVDEITKTIASMKARGLSMLLVEQSLDMALELADYVYVMSKGKIVYEAVPAVFDKNEEIKHMYLGVGE
ncbi:MAG: ABC transporter ATP-binding protein [Deltaproteobacteria bacterium]|nr:ABC transporter ATP-binding protein [Deltaproteobacteria bacterium]